jgi:hypothetical protein
MKDKKKKKTFTPVGNTTSQGGEVPEFKIMDSEPQSPSEVPEFKIADEDESKPQPKAFKMIADEPEEPMFEQTRCPDCDMVFVVKGDIRPAKFKCPKCGLEGVLE